MQTECKRNETNLSNSFQSLPIQAIKQKLKLRAPLNLVDDKQSPQEEDKAKMLFGNRHLVRQISEDVKILSMINR